MDLSVCRFPAKVSLLARDNWSIRADFEKWFPNDAPLRNLSRKIAGLNARASPSFLAAPVQSEWPDNFLANAALGEAWKKPKNYGLKAIASWKARHRPPPTPEESHGFPMDRGLSSRGLALLFDPFTNGFLSAHNLSAGGIAPGCTVICLSDYYHFSGLKLDAAMQEDWGAVETLNKVHGVAKNDPTTTNLFNCILGDDITSVSQRRPRVARSRGVTGYPQRRMNRHGAGKAWRRW